MGHDADVPWNMVVHPPDVSVVALIKRSIIMLLNLCGRKQRINSTREKTVRRKTQLATPPPKKKVKHLLKEREENLIKRIPIDKK